MVIESGMAEIDNLVGNDHLICGPLGRVAGTGKERNLERWGKLFWGTRRMARFLRSRLDGRSAAAGEANLLLRDHRNAELGRGADGGGLHGGAGG